MKIYLWQFKQVNLDHFQNGAYQEVSDPVSAMK